MKLFSLFLSLALGGLSLSAQHLEFEHSFPASSENGDIVQSLIQTHEGGYLLTSWNNGTDVFKLDKKGQPEWNCRLRAEKFEAEQLPDGTFFLPGNGSEKSTNHYSYILTDQGSLKDSSHLGKVDYNVMKKDSAGEIYICYYYDGETASNDLGVDVYVMPGKITKLASIELDQGGSPRGYFSPLWRGGIVTAKDAARKKNKNDLNGSYAIEIEKSQLSNGSFVPQWKKEFKDYTNPDGFIDDPYATNNISNSISEVLSCKDGSHYTAIIERNMARHRDSIGILKPGENGDSLWLKSWPSEGFFPEAYSMEETIEHAIAIHISGYPYKPVNDVIKVINSSGDILHNISLVNFEFTEVPLVKCTMDDGFVIAGTKIDLNGKLYPYVAKLSFQPITLASSLRTNTAVNVFPNPSHNYITLQYEESSAPDQLVLMNAIGETVKTVQNPGRGPISVDDLNAGLYIVCFEKEKQIISRLKLLVR